MPGRAEDIHSYYLILIDFLVFVGFVIVMKVVMLLLMAKLSVVLNDNPQEARQQKALRMQQTTFDQTPAQKWLRMGVGTLLTVSGLLQIQPRMVDISKTAVTHDLGLGLAPGLIHDLVSPFVNLWIANSAWMNVLSSTVQLMVGLVLLTTANRTAVQITALVAGLLAAYDWIGMTGFGGLFVPDASLSGVSPVLGLVYLFLSLMFFVPVRSWQAAETAANRGSDPVVGAKSGEKDGFSSTEVLNQRANAYTYLRIGVIAFWLLQAVLHVLPMEGFWTSSGWNQFLRISNNGTVPGWVANTSNHLAQIISPAAVVVNIITVLLFLAFAAAEWRHKSGRFSKVLRIISIVWLVIAWLGFDHFGFQPVYLFAFGTSPAVILALLILMFGGKQSRQWKADEKTHSPRVNATQSRTV